MRRGVVRIGKAHLLVSPSTRWKLDEGSRFEVRGTVALHDHCSIDVGERAALLIGDGTYLNHNSSIVCVERISIGQGCAISWDVTLLDGDFHSIDGKPSSSPIEIGDDVWIGCGAMILKGTSIGSGSVVAAGAVCSGKYPSNSLIGGVPAKVIRRNISWAR